jgi:FHS family glucose/mannose:H+ symporter-like MFS transporter
MNEPEPHTRTSVTYAALFAGFILTGVVNTILGPLIPWLTARWRLSDVAAGALFTIQFAGGLAGGAVSGAIAARVGAGRTLCAGHALMAVGVAALALGDHRVGATGIAIAGLGLGFVIPTTNLMSARLAPNRPAAALGAVNLCWGIGAAIWPLIVTASVGRSLDAAMGGICALLVGMALIVVRVPFPREQVETASAPATSTMPAFVRLALFGACIALYSGSEAAIGGWITEYARRVDPLGAVEGWEVAAAAFWGGVTGGRALVAVALARRMETRALFAGLVVVFVTLALLLIAPGRSLIVPLAAICGMGFAPVFPVTVAALANEFPPRFAGPMVALGSAGAALLPWLVGVVSDRTGSLSIGMTILLLSVFVLFALQIVRLKPNRHQVTHSV